MKPASAREARVDREWLYREIYARTDGGNMLAISQLDLADEIDVPYQTLSLIFAEFVTIGLMDKNRSKFSVNYSPDKIPWDKYDKLRRKYSEVKRHKEKNYV